MAGRGFADEPGERMSETTSSAGCPQPLRALQLANRVRRARSELKRRVADGRLSAVEVILTSPSEAASMPVAQLLASQRGWGKVRCRALLTRVGMREDKSIGSLTGRQRQAVASQLARTTVRSPLALEIHEGHSAGCVRLSLHGDLDLVSAPTLEDRLAPLRARRSPVRLDLSNLEFIDSTGIHLLIRTIGEARIKRWPVQIEPDVAPQVMRVFRLAHLDQFAISSSNRRSTA